jgi:type II secretory pathway pseudopilin PulG
MSTELPSQFRRSDFIVLVVVIAILGAMATPAIFAARKAARRSQCENNLKILSLGVQNYADTCRAVPLGTVGSRELSPPQRFSWYLPLWVFIEGKPPELQVDTNQAWDAEINRSPQLKRAYSLEPEERLKSYPLHHISIFSCPSASRNVQVQGNQVTQYVGMAGMGKRASELASGEEGIGIWGYDRQVRTDEITDGTAQTMLFTETVRELGPWFAGGPPTVRGFDPAVMPLVGAQGQFGGLHSKVTAAMADASIRQLDPAIDVAVFSALTTIGGRD